MYKLVKSCLEYSRVSFTLFLVLILYGYMSMYSIPKEQTPEITAPYVFISVFQEGVLPEDAEKVIVEPIEQELQDLEGLKIMRSIARESGADFFLEFNTDIDIDTALDNTRAAIDLAKAELPQDAEEPIVNQLSFAQFPVVSLGISGDVDEKLLYQIANDASEQIARDVDVLSADVVGARERVADIVFNSYAMTAYSLTVNSIANSITANNKLIATGALQTKDGRVLIKVPSLFKTSRDILEVPLLSSSTSTVLIKDVAEVRDTFKEPTNYARMNLLNTVVIEVVKRPDSNLFNAIEGAKVELEKYKKTLDSNTLNKIKFVWTQDTSKSVIQTIKELANNIITSVLLVFCVLYVGLNVRSALIASLGIPSTFFISLGLLNMFGITLNLVVLFALILSVGMIIDATVIIIEYADSQLQKGKKPKEAFLEAGTTMFMPLLASTATTVMVFIPLLFWPGIPGQFMGYMPKTLLILLTVSFFVAIFFMTTLGSFLAKRSEKNDKAIEEGAELNYDDIAKVDGILGSYGRALIKISKKPHVVVFSVLAILFFSGGLYERFGKGVEFFPDVEPEFLEIAVKVEGNYSIYEKDSIMKFVENAIPHKEDYLSIYTAVGGDNKSTDEVGNITLELKEWGQRRTADEIIKDTTKALSNLKGIDYEVRKQEQGPSSGKPFSLQVSSNNQANLEFVINKLTDFLLQSDGLINVANSLPKAVIDLNIEIDKQKAALVGLDTAQIGRFLTMITNGAIVGSYRPNDWSEEIDIRVRFEDELRVISNIETMMINSNNGPISLETIINVKEVVSSGFIKRTDGNRAYDIEADLVPGVVLGQELRRTLEFIEKEKLKDLVDFRFRGEAEDQGESAGFLAGAFLVAICAIALILLLQFNSFFYVFVILFSVVMSTVGVMLGLIIIRQPFGVIMSGLAVIFLAGIVVNNNIVLIDTLQSLTKQNKKTSFKLNVIRSCVERFRPIMLTSITTVLGLLPMALKLNLDFFSRKISYNLPSSQWWAQLSSSIVAGMLFSTLLTLFFTPALLIFYRRLQIAWQRRWKKAFVLKVQTLFAKYVNKVKAIVFVCVSFYLVQSNKIKVFRVLNYYVFKAYSTSVYVLSEKNLDYLAKEAINSGNLPKYKPLYEKSKSRFFVLEEKFYIFVETKVLPFARANYKKIKSIFRLKTRVKSTFSFVKNTACNLVAKLKEKRKEKALRPKKEKKTKVKKPKIKKEKVKKEPKKKKPKKDKEKK